MTEPIKSTRESSSHEYLVPFFNDQEQLEKLSQEGVCAQDETSRAVFNDLMTLDAEAQYGELSLSAAQQKERLRLKKAAKQICRLCPVLIECQRYALENANIHQLGVLGGLTRDERKSSAEELNITRRRATKGAPRQSKLKNQRLS